jgi:DNA-binding SARP family transcriptional activator
MLEIDPCRESPHQRLMRSWSRQGVPHLAVRQYHICREALGREVGLQPSDETTDLFERIRQRKQV